MHKLDRPTAPSCLKNYQHGQHNWGHVSHDDKNEIWQQLDIMQQKRCAYCEATLENNNGDRKAHIEHLRQRDRYPQGTFQWQNLFGSCNRQHSCGNYKDKLPPYNHKDIIKMDEENPEDFFLFITDGTIAINSNLSEQDTRRAQETLRIFNLDSTHGSLRQMRASAIQGYIQTAEELLQLAEEFDTEDWDYLLEEELEQIKLLPFATAIKHTLMPTINNTP